MKFNFRESLFRIWYWYVNRADKNAEILFMNYGYSEKDQETSLEKEDEANRYSIQLYHHLASSASIKGKDIVEIGCGRGGGLSYIVKNFQPATAIGVDLDKLAVSFSNSHYSLKGLSFKHGDAQNLSLENESCDVLFNVESSHRYPDMAAFLKEVYRILRHDGYFLFTDFRYDYEMEELQKDLASCGMTIETQKIINQEVVAALTKDDERKRKLIKKLAPKFLHKIALNFAGTIGSKTYQQFADEKYVYFSYVLKKV
ncbi:class I SAM-dependent methyltransferase [Bacteroidota bacterium]